MLLDIFLRDGKNIQVPDFEKFKTAYKGSFNEFEAEQLSSTALLEKATYYFIGKNSVMVVGKDILYLEVK